MAGTTGRFHLASDAWFKARGCSTGFVGNMVVRGDVGVRSFCQAIRDLMAVSRETMGARGPNRQAGRGLGAM